MLKVVPPEVRKDFELSLDEIAPEGAKRMFIQALNLEVMGLSPASSVRLGNIWKSEFDFWSKRKITKSMSTFGPAS